MKEKKKLKEVAEMKSVYVNDFLSKDCLELLNYAKSLKAVGFKFVYAHAGKIFAKKDVNARQILLKELDDVDQLLKSSVSKTAKVSGRRAGNDNDDDEIEDETEDEEEDDDDEDGFLSPN